MNRFKLAIALLPMIGCFGAAIAADLGPYEPVETETQPLVELGTGWYLRGDVGLGTSDQAQITADIVPSATKGGWSADAGIGYKLNNWFRVDATYNFMKKQRNGITGATVVCPYNLTGLTDQATGFLLGYVWGQQVGTCNGRENAQLRKEDLLFNGYIDLGTWYGFTPYIGGGLGVARLNAYGSINYYKTSDGSIYNANLSPVGGFPLVWLDPSGRNATAQAIVPTTGLPVAFAQQNWAKIVNKTKYNLAFALMGGIAYNITSHAIIDIGYRYLNEGSFRALPLQGTNSVSKTLTTQEIRVGIRYLID